MIFSSPELAALNSISGGGSLAGIRLAVPHFDKQKELWASVNESLKQKNIVGEDGHLTQLGMIPVRVVEMYRTAQKYAFLGNTRVSLNGDSSVTVISPVDKGWQVIRTAKEVLMVSLLEKFPFLCGGSAPTEHPRQWEPMPYETWVDSVAESGPENLLVANSCLRGGVPTDLMAYGLSSGKGYEYNMSRARGRQTSVRDIRVTVAALIGIEGSDLDVID